MNAFGSLREAMSKFRSMTLWGVMTCGMASFVYVGAYEFPAYFRRSELQSRVFHGCKQRLFSPFAYQDTIFRSRSRLPNFVSNSLGTDWTLPLEPIIYASLVPRSDDDVGNLAPEVELEHVSIVAEDGKCTDQLLRHLVALPKLQALELCNVPLTDQGIELLLQMPQLRHLHIECAADQSPGLNRLSEFAQVEKMSITDTRCPVSNEVYRQIAEMPCLRELRLCGTKVTDSH